MTSQASGSGEFLNSGHRGRALSPTQWQFLDHLMDDFLRDMPSRATAYLAAHCADKPYLAQEARRMLQAHGGAERLLDGSVWTHAERSAQAGDEALIRDIEKDRRFEVVGLLGEGGMGRVYHARQLLPFQRDVALKVLMTGAGRELSEVGLLLECKALARLNHEHVARIYSAGCTAAGLPYLSMEFAPGLDILTYCDTHHLGLAARLEVFLQVCEGLDHAHGRQILHRDIKPSNILVAGDGRYSLAKIIDFGIAVMLDGRAEQHGATVPVAGTIAYMSPEQLSGSALDVRADIYALGVLLYRLVTGCAPYPTDLAVGESREARVARMHQAPPETPARAVMARVKCGEISASEGLIRANRLKGELDYLILKAMHPRSEKRHARVSDLAADLRAYLTHHPIAHYRPNRAYRWAKFAQRNKRAVSVVAGFLVMLTTMVVVLSVLLWRVEQQSAAAEAARAVEARRAGELEDALYFIQEFLAFSRPDRNLGDAGYRDTLPNLEHALRSHRHSSPMVRAWLFFFLGRTYMAVGERDRAVGAFRAALEMREAFDGGMEEAVVLEALASALSEQGQWDEAAGMYAEVIADTCDMRLRYHAMRGYGNLCRVRGDLVRARRLYEEVLAWPGNRADDLTTLRGLALVYQAEGWYAQAELLFFEVYQDQYARLGERHPKTMNALNNWASSLYGAGSVDQAQVLFEESARTRRLVSGGRHPDTLDSLFNYAGALYAREHYGQASEVLTEVCSLRVEVLGARHPETLSAQMLQALCRARLDPASGIPALESVLTRQERVLGADHPYVFATANNLADHYLRHGATDKALTLLARILPRQSARYGARDPGVLVARCTYGEALLRAGRRTDAATWFKDLSRDAADGWVADEQRLVIEGLFGVSLIETGESVRGRELLRRVRRDLGDHFPEYTRTFMHYLNGTVGETATVGR